MGLSIRGYARHRGVTHQAVRKALATGRITVGADGGIDPAVADRAWAATTAPRPPGIEDVTAQGRGAAVPPAAVPGLNAGTFLQARTATMLAEAQLRRLRLEERRGQLLDRQAVLSRVFAFVRGARDAWLGWPARVAARLGAEAGVDQARVAIALEGHVRRHLEELAATRFELGGPRRE